MRVAAPVRTWTSGQSTSSAEILAAPPAAATSLVAFDDELKRSKGEDLSRSVLPQPPSANANAMSASVPAPLRTVCSVRPLPIVRLTLLGASPPWPALIASQPYSKPSVATQRRRGSIGVVLEPCIKQMILPYPIDAQIVARIALALKAGLLQQADRGGIARNAGRLQAMQPQRPEAERDQSAHRRGHVAFAGERRAGPVADAAGLRDTAADIGKREPADQRIVFAAKDQEGIGEIVAQVLGIALEPPAERAAREIVGGPSRLPGHQEVAARFTQGRPLGIVAALRHAQRHPGAGDGR